MMIDIVQDLKNVEEKYKGQKTSFGEVIISDMARDSYKEIERLKEENEKRRYHIRQIHLALHETLGKYEGGDYL